MVNYGQVSNQQVWICGPVMIIGPASADETVQVLHEDTIKSKQPPPIQHPTAVRSILPLPLTDLEEPYLVTGAGEMIRIYDISSLGEPEFIRDIDAHWHDVTAIRLWSRRCVGEDGNVRIEPWIVSVSLDGTIRKWRLSGTSVPSRHRHAG